MLIEDATGTMTALQFEPLGVERSRVPLAVCYVDHNVLHVDERNKEDHVYLQAFCRRFGIHYSKPGNGISHYVHLERFGVPGQLMIGADSHTSTAGALGMLAVGVGGLEVAVAIAGHPFELMRPVVSGVELARTMSTLRVLMSSAATWAARAALDWVSPVTICTS